MVVEIWGKGLLNVRLLIDGETRFGWSRNLGHGPPRFGSSAGEKPAPPGSGETQSDNLHRAPWRTYGSAHNAASQIWCRAMASIPGPPRRGARPERDSPGSHDAGLGRVPAEKHRDCAQQEGPEQSVTTGGRRALFTFSPQAHIRVSSTTGSSQVRLPGSAHEPEGWSVRF